MKIILGGGLIALLARDILGDTYEILPMGKSLYYSFKPPLADNFVVRDESIDDYVDQFAFMHLAHKIGYSFAGHITYNHDLALDNFLNKKYGDDVPSHMSKYMKTHNEFFAYGDCVEIYERLQDRYKDEIHKNNERWGKAKKIAEHVISTDKGKSIEYDKMVNTIPLYAITKMLGCTFDLPSRDMWCYHLRTEKLDFEGATSLLICDNEIEKVYQASRISEHNYLFFANDRIEYPGKFFMQMIEDFDLVGETSIEKAIPCGDIPKLDALEDNGIKCAGSTAVWDDALDVGSCIKRLISFKG